MLDYVLDLVAGRLDLLGLHEGRVDRVLSHLVHVHVHVRVLLQVADHQGCHHAGSVRLRVVVVPLSGLEEAVGGGAHRVSPPALLLLERLRHHGVVVEGVVLLLVVELR